MALHATGNWKTRWVSPPRLQWKAVRARCDCGDLRCCKNTSALDSFDIWKKFVAERKAQSTSIQNGQNPLDTSDQTETETQKSSRKPWNWKPLTRSNQRKTLLLQHLLPTNVIFQKNGIAARAESWKVVTNSNSAQWAALLECTMPGKKTSGRNSLQSYHRNITKVRPSQNPRAWKPLPVHINIVTHPLQKLSKWITSILQR